MAVHLRGMGRQRTSNVWKKSAATLGGALVILAGLIMLVTPGPGLLALVAGLAILATEYDWAERRLHQLRQKLSRRRRQHGQDEPPPAA